MRTRKDTPPTMRTDERLRTPWSAVRRMRAFSSQLWTGKITLAAVLLLAAIVGASLVALPVSSRWYDVQALGTAVRKPPSFRPLVSLDLYEPGPSKPAGAAVTIAHSLSSWFGYDNLGRSLFYRVMPGFLVSLSIGLSAAAVAVVVGSVWGATAALLGGRVDLVMMRVVDILYGLPYILMVILLKVGLTRPLTALLGGHTKYADIVILFVAIGGVAWLTMARVIRGQVLSLRSRPFVEAARAAGAGHAYILRRHLLPNLMGPIITYAMLVIPQAILQESFLSFLGIGVQAPTPSLGRLAADGVEAVNTFVGYWWLIVFPCAVLVITLLSLNLIGDALRDRFDPKATGAVLV